MCRIHWSMYLLIAGKNISFVSSVISIQSCITSKAASTVCWVGFFFGGSVVSFTSLSSSSSVSLFLAAIILSTMSLSVTASVVITVRRSGHNPQTANKGGARLGECHLLGLLHRYQENRYAHWWQLLLNRRGGSSFQWSSLWFCPRPGLSFRRTSDATWWRALGSGPSNSG